MIKLLHVSLILLFSFSATILVAQAPTQTVRGKIYDSETNFSLVGVKVEIKTNSNINS
jgi:hypothetical protein